MFHDLGIVAWEGEDGLDSAGRARGGAVWRRRACRHPQRAAPPATRPAAAARGWA